ncbi:UNVERIFIED_CONTAM: SWI2/SNF2 Brahma-like putative [Hammondia hammondi]|eukprot:XP_008887116.1 SWI2/SNF2 Brahma-like putative [Hammondia hammondi]
MPHAPPPQQRAHTGENSNGPQEGAAWEAASVLSSPSSVSAVPLRMPGLPSNPSQVAQQHLLSSLPGDRSLYPPDSGVRDRGPVSSALRNLPGPQTAPFSLQALPQVDSSSRFSLAGQNPFVALGAPTPPTAVPQAGPLPLRPPSPSAQLPAGFSAGQVLGQAPVGFSASGGAPARPGASSSAPPSSLPPAQRLPSPVSSDALQASSRSPGTPGLVPPASQAVSANPSLGAFPPSGVSAASPGLPFAGSFSSLRGGSVFSPSVFAPHTGVALLQAPRTPGSTPVSAHLPVSALGPSGETLPGQIFPRESSLVSAGGAHASAAVPAYPLPLAPLQNVSTKTASPPGAPEAPDSSSRPLQTITPGGARVPGPGLAGETKGVSPLSPEAAESQTPTNKPTRQGAVSSVSPSGPSRLAGAPGSGDASRSPQRPAGPLPSISTPRTAENSALSTYGVKTDLDAGAKGSQMSSEDARPLGNSFPNLPFLASAGLPQVSSEGHFYSAFCRLLYELSLRQVSLVDKRVRILLLIFHWLKQRPEEHQDPGHIFRDRQFERLVLQTRAYIHLLSQKPLEAEQLQQLRLIPSLGFSVDHAFLDAVRSYRSSLGSGGPSATKSGGGAGTGAPRSAGAWGAAHKASQMLLQKRRERSTFVELKEAAEAIEREETALRLQRRIENLERRLACVKATEDAAVVSAEPGAPRPRSRLREGATDATETNATEGDSKQDKEGEKADKSEKEERDEGRSASDKDGDVKRSLEIQEKEGQEADASGDILKSGDEDVVCGHAKDEDVDLEAREPKVAVVPAGQSSKRTGETITVEKGEDGIEVITVCVEDDETQLANGDLASDLFLERALGPALSVDAENATQLPSSSSLASSSPRRPAASSLARFCAETADELRRARLHSRLLALLPLQSSVRQGVALQRMLEEAPDALPPLLHVSVRTARKHRLLREQREQAEEFLERRAQDAQRRQVFLSALLEVHRRNFVNVHRESLKQVRRVAAAVKRRRACFLGAEGEDGAIPEELKSEALGEDARGGHCGHHLHPTKCGCPAAAADLAAMKRRERLDALKKHDEAAYLALLQETKNERLLLLVRQTEEYMRKMGDLIIEQREREGAEIVDPIDLPAGEGETTAAPADGETAEGLEASQSEETNETEDAKMEQGDGKEGDATEEEEKNKASLSSFLLSKERYYRLTHAKRVHVTELPKCLKGGSLRSYQMEGLNWMASLYTNGLNGILADSMGLGKTVQTVSFLAYLHEVKRARNPFLIVAPLSTIHGNWRSELKKWWPSINLVVYEGTKEYRKQLRSRIVGGLNTRGPGAGTATALGSSVSDAVSKPDEVRGAQGADAGTDGARRFVEPYFHALLTTDAVILRDKSFLRKIKWEYLVVDEAHRLKNPNSKLVQTLNTGFHIKRRLALTGTPLQNDIGEVWALLNFLMPSIFNAKLNFEQWLNVPLAAPPTLFGGASQQDEHLINITEEEKLLIVDRLHKVLRPFLLRREKAEVADELPSKQEEIVWCPLSGVQRYLYKMIEGNPVGQNRMVQLRKICNHPYLFCYSSYTPDESLVRCCGKFAMLDVLLPALKMGNHRVLIFSQMTKLLDILEVYLSLRGHTYLRLDGGTSSEERQKRLSLYNQEGSEYFIFILSTKAGGLGVNLQSADTVIIFDSDWNPQNDEQALSRAHRIGQKKEVLTLRFISVESIEEQILQRAECKLDKDKLVIQSGMYYGHGQEEVHDPSRDLARTNQVREILRKQRQLDVNLTRALDLQLLKRQIARSSEDMRVFERADCIRRLLHVPGLITSEMLPPCLFSWCKAAERAQEALVSASQKKEAEDAWKRIYSRSDFWTIREEKASPQSPLGLASTSEPPSGASSTDASSSSSFSSSSSSSAVCASSASSSERVGSETQEKTLLSAGGEKKEGASPPAEAEGPGLHTDSSCEKQREQGSSEVEKCGPDAAESEKKEGQTSSPSAEEDTEDLPKTHDDATAASALLARRVSDLPLWRATVNTCIREAVNAAIACRDFDVFVELPSKEIYKDYFERVKKPICLLSIRAFADKQEFTSLSKLEKHLTRLAVNARLYNGAESPIFLRAVECMGFVMRESRRRLCVAFHTLVDPSEAAKVTRLLDYFFSFTVGSGGSLHSASLDKNEGSEKPGGEEEEEEEDELSVVSESRVSSSLAPRVSVSPAHQVSCPPASFPSSFPLPRPAIFSPAASSVLPALSPPVSFPASFPASPAFPDSQSYSASPPGGLLETAPSSVAASSSFPQAPPSQRRPLLKIFPMRISLSSQGTSRGNQVPPTEGFVAGGESQEVVSGLQGHEKLRVSLASASSSLPSGHPGAELRRGSSVLDEERTGRELNGTKRGRKRGRPARKDPEKPGLPAKNDTEPMPQREGVGAGGLFPAFAHPAFPAASPYSFPATTAAASPPTAVGGDGVGAPDEEGRERSRARKEKKKKEKREKSKDEDGSVVGEDGKRRKKVKEARHREDERSEALGSAPTALSHASVGGTHLASGGPQLAEPATSFSGPADTGAKKFRIRLPQAPYFPASGPLAFPGSHAYPGTVASPAVTPSLGANAIPTPAYASPVPTPGTCSFSSFTHGERVSGEKGEGGAAPTGVSKFRIRIASQPQPP